MKNIFLSWTGSALLLSTLLGCNGNVIDCAQVCSAYADCVDSDLDVPECTADCEDRADESENHEQRLEDCEACIEGLSCTESIACGAECAGVIDPTE